MQFSQAHLWMVESVTLIRRVHFVTCRSTFETGTQTKHTMYHRSSGRICYLPLARCGTRRVRVCVPMPTADAIVTPFALFLCQRYILLLSNTIIISRYLADVNPCRRKCHVLHRHQPAQSIRCASLSVCSSRAFVVSNILKRNQRISRMFVLVNIE